LDEKQMRPLRAFCNDGKTHKPNSATGKPVGGKIWVMLQKAKSSSRPKIPNNHENDHQHDPICRDEHGRVRTNRYQ
jgi:hypothetical protein